MNDQARRQDPADEELEARLDRYARARLGSDPASMAHIRENVMIQARAQAQARAAGRWPALRALFRRPILGLAGAALLVLVIVGGAAAASGAGGPLYGARLWVETMTLPTDPVARTDAELVRLEDRLVEAQAAAGAGNVGAAAAAIQAYDDTVDQAVAAAGNDPGREQQIKDALAKHQAVLEALVIELAGRGNASDAIRRALDESQQAIDRIDARGQPGSSTATPDQPTTGNGQGPNATPPGQGPKATPPVQGPNDTPPAQGPKATPPGQEGPKPTPKGKGTGGAGSGGSGSGSGSQPTPAP